MISSALTYLPSHRGPSLNQQTCIRCCGKFVWGTSVQCTPLRGVTDLFGFASPSLYGTPGEFSLLSCLSHFEFLFLQACCACLSRCIIARGWVNRRRPLASGSCFGESRLQTLYPVLPTDCCVIDITSPQRRYRIRMQMDWWTGERRGPRMIRVSRRLRSLELYD